MTDSVALIVLDTLRKDFFDEYFDWLDGLQFNNALSPSHWTTPVHGALFTGAYPSETGVHAHNPTLDCPQPTLAEKLSQEGWTCRGFSANGNVASSTEFDRGFDEFTAKGYHSSADIFHWQNFLSTHADAGWFRYPLAAAACITSESDTLPSFKRGLRIKYDDYRHGGPKNLTIEEAIKYINSTTFGNQEFLFLNLMEAHDSYTPPSDYQTVKPPAVTSITALAEVLNPTGRINTQKYKKAYEDSVRYLSERYRELHTQLNEIFDYVIVTSDHGEALGTDGIYGHIPSLIPEIVRVPLTITGNNIPSKNSQASVNILDIHRTITDIAGVAPPPRGENLINASGRSTVTEAHGISNWQRESLRNHEVSADQLRLVEEIRRGISDGDHYVYESLSDGWVSTIGDGSALRAELNQFVDKLVERETDQRTVSEEVRTQLENMGYV
jgi:arylsulfatase